MVLLSASWSTEVERKEEGGRREEEEREGEAREVEETEVEEQARREGTVEGVK